MLPFMPFSVSSFSPVAKLGYQAIQATYESFDTIEEVNDNAKVEDVSLIIADPSIIQEYVDFFNGKLGEVREGLEGHINQIESSTLSCRMQFGSENSKSAHNFLTESWGLKETSKKLWGYLSGKRVFLTDGIPPYKLAVASKAGRIDAGGSFFELDDVKRDLIMVFADLVTFLQVHTANSLDPKKLSQATTDADISTMANKSGTVYTYVSLDIVMLFIITNHLYNILNTTHYLYQNGSLVYPTLYAHIDHLNEYVTTIVIPLLEQKQQKNLQERSKAFKESTAELMTVLDGSTNKHLKTLSGMIGKVGDEQIEQISYMNSTPSSSVANFLAKKSFSNISANMQQIKSFVKDVAEQKGHFDQMQELISQNTAAIDASKQMIKMKPNEKKFKIFGGNFGSRMLGGSDLGGKFKKAIPPFEVARLSQSYFQSVLYKVEYSAPTAMLKYIHESMPLMNYCFELVKPILRLMFSYNDISLNSSMINTFISNLYLKMFSYYDAFFEEVEKSTKDEHDNIMKDEQYKNSSINLTIMQLGEDEEGYDESQKKYIITNISYGGEDINLKNILTLLFGVEPQAMAFDTSEVIPLIFKVEVKTLTELQKTLTLDVFLKDIKDIEMVPVIQSWIDKVICIKKIAKGNSESAIAKSSLEETKEPDLHGFGDDITQLLKNETLKEVKGHFKQSSQDLDKLIASCYPIEMPMLQFLFRKRTALSVKSLQISGVTPFHLLLDYCYSMVVHSYVVHYAKQSKQKADVAISKFLNTTGETVSIEESEIPTRLKTLISGFVELYEGFFKVGNASDISNNAEITKVVDAIASNSKNALLPSLALSLATLMSVFERLVILDVTKRSASATIKQYGSMIFHNAAFVDELENLYTNEQKIAQVLESIVYKFLPEVERYADTINNDYWLEALKKVYTSTNRQLMILSNNLYKHGTMAVQYLKKSRVYLHDEEKVELKQKTYLTLMTNINTFLQQQNFTSAYPSTGAIFEYDTFVQSAIISQEDALVNVKDQASKILEKVTSYTESKCYEKETVLFFYSMLRGGAWSCFSSSPITTTDFVLTSLDTRSIAFAFSNDATQKIIVERELKYKAPIAMFMDINEQIVKGFINEINKTDWCLLEIANSTTVEEDRVKNFDKMIIWLQFVPEQDNPLRQSLIYQKEQVQSLFTSFKSNELGCKKNIVAALLLGLTYDKELYKHLKPSQIDIALETPDEDDFNAIIDQFAQSFSYTNPDMPGSMYYILFGLYTVITDIAEIQTKFQNAQANLVNLELEDAEVETVKKLFVYNNKIKLDHVAKQIELTVAVIQLNIHASFTLLKDKIIDQKFREEVTPLIKKQAAGSIERLQDRFYNTDLYQSSQKVLILLDKLSMLTESDVTTWFGSKSSTRVRNIFDFQLKSSKPAPAFVTSTQFNWSPERFETSKYIPERRLKISSIPDCNLLAIYILDQQYLKKAFEFLSYPAGYSLVEYLVSEILSKVNIDITLNTLPVHSSPETVAVAVLMMSYLVKGSYIFDTKPIDDSQNVVSSLIKVENLKFKGCWPLYTNYKEHFESFYTHFDKQTIFTSLVEGEDLEFGDPARTSHFIHMNRLFHADSFKKYDIDTSYKAHDRKYKTIIKRTSSEVSQVSAIWYKNFDLYDNESLINEYKKLESAVDEITALKSYVTKFSTAIVSG